LLFHNVTPSVKIKFPDKISEGLKKNLEKLVRYLSASPFCNLLPKRLCKNPVM